MFDLFKNKPNDVKGIRSGLLQFIKEQLQKAEGGEGENIKSISLFITCSDEERHLYEAALYAGDEERFKNEEVQKIADDYAIALPQTWSLHISFIKEAPPETIQATDVDAALFFATRSKAAVPKTLNAVVTVLHGQAEHQSYTFTSKDGRINIGREKETQTADGFFRKNDIALLGSNSTNRSVSRQHAHIEWNEAEGEFYLYADEGGIPPKNKLKVKAADGAVIKVQTTEFGYCLQQGDQIVLGNDVVLEFTCRK